MALMNKGLALSGLGRLTDAVVEHDRAIAIRRRLVEAVGRSELTIDLARALTINAMVLEIQEEWSGALACYETAIGWREACIRWGMSHLLGDLMRMIRYRLMTLLYLQR